MTEVSHPYAGTRAASQLADGLKRYTARHPGGLRGLATELKIKQATVLSHMANGRIGIPLDRATELAAKLDLDLTAFSLAVLEQRAPSVYEALDQDLGLGRLASSPPALRRGARVVASARVVTNQHVEIIKEVLADRHPAERWLRLEEVPAIAMIREQYPDGPTVSDLGSLRAAIDVVREIGL